MTSSRTTLSTLRPPWTAAIAVDRCNYHPAAPAVAKYAGTPVCKRCADRLGLP